MRKTIAMAVTVAMLSGCASAAGSRTATTLTQPGVVSTAAMAEYVEKLPAGSKVRVESTDGGVLRGTLMKATDDTIVVQKNTRVAESPIEIPMAQIARVTVDSGGGTSTGKAV